MARTDNKWAFILALVVVCMVVSPRSEAFTTTTTAVATARRNFDRDEETYGRITGPLHEMP